MRLLLLSDLHFDHHADGGRAFIASQRKDVDCVLVAGDLAHAAMLEESLRLLCEAYPQVLFVAGNHDYWGGDPEQIRRKRLQIADALPNLLWLDESVVMIDGRRFLGTTLWFPETPSAAFAKWGMNDFRMIKNFEPWVYEKNRQAQRFLMSNIMPGDIVMTHHLPLRRSIPEDFRGSPLNAFYVCDLDRLVATGGARLWLHGHTHEAQDYVYGGTRVVCNAFGYVGQRTGFVENLTIDV